jgi:phosphohistidine phosphatase
MKRLILVRHATAVDSGPEGSDFHRRLKKRGRREALVMAGRVEAAVGIPDQMLSSPADRALETAQIFAARLGIPGERVTLREELYGGLLPEEFLQLVQRIDDGVSTVMLFGHDPSFTEFAAHMVKDFHAGIPKAGVLVIDIDRPRWGLVRAGDGRAALFDRPPAPDAQKRIEADLLERLVLTIRSAILGALRDVGLAEHPEAAKLVARSSARLARDLRPLEKRKKPRVSKGKKSARGKKERRAGATRSSRAVRGRP